MQSGDGAAIMGVAKAKARGAWVEKFILLAEEWVDFGVGWRGEDLWQELGIVIDRA